MPYNVVIIDDEHWTREVIKSLVDWDALGLIVVGESSDGAFGLELIEKFKPEIIITDVAMPNMNGLDLVGRLRKTGNSAEIIIVSGYDDFEYIHSAMKLDVSDYLLKPIKPDALNEQLRSCINKIHEKQKDLESRVEISATGFLDAPWSEAFQVLKGKAHDSLYACEIDTMVTIFSDMDRLMSHHAEAAYSKSAMIYIYFSLVEQLQQFINEKGFRISDLYGGAEAQFVFNHDSTTQQMLLFICNQYCKVAKEVQYLIKNRNRLDVSLIKRYLEEHYTESLSLEQTANRFFVSKEYLSKVFKSEIGIGFSDFVTQLRMEKAKHLILEQNVPIKETGYMVGYLEQAHFYKKFKSYFGMTPGEMKQTLKNDNQLA